MKPPGGLKNGLAASLVLLLVLSSCGRKAKQADSGAVETGSPRDLLLVTLDTFRADRAGCFGNPEGLTPSIDRALRSGLLARNAYAPAPLTGISHATILTGLQPYRHGVRDNALFPLADSVTTLADHLGKKGFRTAAFIAAFPLKKEFGFDQGFQTFDEELGPDPAAETHFAERPAHEVVDRALAWVNGLAPGDRAFLWTHVYDPHHPYDPPPVFRRLAVTGDYEREIREADLQIGRLLRGIEAAGRRPLVVIVSDHGEGLGDHRELHHGILVTEEVMRGLIGFAAPSGTPLATRLHGFHEGVIRYTEIVPTALEALGVDAMPDLDGFSLLTSTTSDGAYGETYYSTLHYRWSPLLSWRDDRWAYLEGPNPKLYDRIADPGERRNLIAEQPDIADAMSRQIAEVALAPKASAAQELDEEAKEKLAALGYVGAAPHSEFDPKKDPQNFLDELEALRLGIALLAQGQAQAALPLLQTAYGADPDNPTAVVNLAHCWRILGDAATAMSYYRRALDIDPRNPKAWAHFALLRFKQGDKADAFKLLEQGLLANPDAFPLLMTAAELSRSVGKLDEAKRHLQHAAEVAPERFEPWDELAKLEEHQGNVAEARRLKDRARALAPRESAASR